MCRHTSKTWGGFLFDMTSYLNVSEGPAAPYSDDEPHPWTWRHQVPMYRYKRRYVPEQRVPNSHRHEIFTSHTWAISCLFWSKLIRSFPAHKFELQEERFILRRWQLLKRSSYYPTCMEPYDTQSPSLASVTNQLSIACPLTFYSVRIILILCHLRRDLPATVQ